VNRTVDVVFLELEDDLDEARRIATEISTGVSDPVIVMIYRPQVVGGDGRSASLLIDLMRAGARDFLRRPVATSEVEDLLRRHFEHAGEKKAPRGRVISFIGNKGGVGKSTLSLSVACSLAQRAPDRVLLIDASLQHGAMCELLGVEPEATVSDAARQVDRLDERLLRMLSTPHESGLRVLAAPPNAIDAAPVDDQAFARILSVARRAFDFVIVDTFPLIDSITVAILDVADLAFVVLNDFIPAVLGTAELLSVLGRLGVSEERIRVVLNHANGGYRGRLRDADVARRLDHDLNFVVPFSRKVLAATNTGEPFVMRAPKRWGFGKAIRLIEDEILRSTPYADYDPLHELQNGALAESKDPIGDQGVADTQPLERELEDSQSW